MSRIQIRVTITKIFDAEFEDTLAASRMFKALERDPAIAVLTGTTGEGWSVRQTSTSHGVRVENEDPRVEPIIA